MKYYIDRDEWVKRLEEEYNECEDEKRKVYIRIQINSIICQPVVTKEDILKEDLNN